MLLKDWDTLLATLFAVFLMFVATFEARFFTLFTGAATNELIVFNGAFNAAVDPLFIALDVLGDFVFRLIAF